MLTVDWTFCKILVMQLTPVNDDKVNVRVDNKTVKINNNNQLTAQSGVKNGRVVWGVVNTFGNKSQQLDLVTGLQVSIWVMAELKLLLVEQI